MKKNSTLLWELVLPLICVLLWQLGTEENEELLSERQSRFNNAICDFIAMNCLQNECEKV